MNLGLGYITGQVCNWELFLFGIKRRRRRLWTGHNKWKNKLCFRAESFLHWTLQPQQEGPLWWINIYYLDCSWNISLMYWLAIFKGQLGKWQTPHQYQMIETPEVPSANKNVTLVSDVVWKRGPSLEPYSLQLRVPSNYMLWWAEGNQMRSDVVEEIAGEELQCNDF